MQRSVLHFRTTSRPRRGARLLGIVAVSSALVLTLGAGAAQAGGHGGGGHSGYGGGGYGGGYGGGGGQTPKPSATAKPEATGAYVYLKIDPRQEAAWANSTQQYLFATWSGGYFRDDFTLAEIQAALPADVALCGSGWGVQQDKVYGDETVFTGHKAPFFPTDYIGWWDEKTQKGYIHDADHWELHEVVTGYVPKCGPKPTSTPTVAPTPTQAPVPAPSQTVPAPTPSETSAPTPSVTPTPVDEVDDEPTSTPTPTTEVLASTPTPTPSATFYSEVLADGGTDASLAATGSSPLPGLLAGGILVLAGAGLLLARRLRTT